jgi:hypothetical protein
MFAEHRRYAVGDLWAAMVIDASGRPLGGVHAIGFGSDGWATKVAVADGDNRLRFLPLEGAELEQGRLHVRRSIPVLGGSAQTMA